MARVSGTLEPLRSMLALLQRHPRALPPAAELQQAQAAFTASVNEMRNREAAGVEEVGVGAARLARQIGQLGGLLAGLDVEVQRAAQRRRPTRVAHFEPHMDAGMRCLHAACSAYLASSPTAADREGLLSGMALLLGSGRLMLERTAADGWAQRYPRVSDQLRTALSVLAASMGHGLQSALAASAVDAVLAPAQTIRWLAELTEALAAAPEHLRTYEDMQTHALLASALLLQQRDGACASLQAAVQEEEGVQQRLVPPLLSTLQLVAARVLEPREVQQAQRDRQPQQAQRDHQRRLDWCCLERCLQLISSNALRRGMVGFLLQQRQQFTALFQLATRLLEGLPIECLTPTEVQPDHHFRVWEAATKLVAMVQAPLFWQDEQQVARQAASYTSLRSVPRLAAAWQRLLAEPCLQPHVHLGLSSLKEALAAVCDRDVQIISAEQLGVVLAAANAAVRLLPQLDRRWPEGGQLNEAHRQALSTAEGSLPQQLQLQSEAHAAHITLSIMELLAVAADKGLPYVNSQPDPRAEALTAQAPASLQLHARTRRVVQWLALEERRSFRLFLGWKSALMMASRSLDLFRQLVWPLLDTDELLKRQYCAALAAHWEALQTASNRMGRPLLQIVAGNQSADEAYDVALNLAWVAEQAPTAQLSPTLLRELHTAVQVAREGSMSAEIRLRTAELVWWAAGRSAPVCAALLLAGTLEPGFSALAKWQGQQLPEFANQFAYNNQPFGPNLVGWHASALLHLNTCAQEMANTLSSSADPTACALGQQLQAAALQLEARLPVQVRAPLLDQFIALRAQLDGVSAAEVEEAALAVARLLQQHWALPQQQAAAQLELARACAARGCAYLRCANVEAGTALQGGAVGREPGSLRCAGCKAVRYCGTACSHADWRGTAGHRRVCAALAAERQAQLAQRAQHGE